MSKLSIIYTKSPDVTSISSSITGCGFVDLTIPASLKCEEINPAISEYIKGNIDDLTKKTKKAVEAYREKWHNMLDSLYYSCGLNQIVCSFSPSLRIAQTNGMVSITPECHGLVTQVKCTFDPVLSLMSDESAERLIKPDFLRAAAELFDITQGPVRVRGGVFNDDLSDVEFTSETVYENPAAAYHSSLADELRNSSYSADYDLAHNTTFRTEFENILSMNILTYKDRRSA